MASTGLPSLDSTMGSVYIGVVVSAMLSGITYVQTFYYFTNYPKDRWLLKSMVICTVIFDTAHQALISHAIYYYLVTNYNNPTTLSHLVWSGSVEFFFSVSIAFLVQCFYVLRIWHMSKNYLLTGSVLVIVLASAACGLVWTILSIITPTFQELQSIVPVSIAIYALASAADILIAASLIAILHKARTGIEQSETMINKLILLIVNTGALTSLMEVALLIAMAASPKTLIYVAFDFTIVRFYTNSFLATLNARKYLTAKDDEKDDSIEPTHLFVRSTAGSSVGDVPPYSSKPIGIETSREWDGRKAHSNKNHDKGYVDVVHHHRCMCHIPLQMVIRERDSGAREDSGGELDSSHIIDPSV